MLFPCRCRCPHLPPPALRSCSWRSRPGSTPRTSRRRRRAPSCSASRAGRTANRRGATPLKNERGFFWCEKCNPTNNAILINFRLSSDAEIVVNNHGPILQIVQKRACNVYSNWASFSHTTFGGWEAASRINKIPFLFVKYAKVLYGRRMLDKIYFFPSFYILSFILTLCDCGCSGLVGMVLPSLYQTILGSGSPSALQLSVSGSFFGTVMEVGCSVMCGERNWPGITEKEQILSMISM